MFDQIHVIACANPMTTARYFTIPKRSPNTREAEAGARTGSPRYGETGYSVGGLVPLAP